MTFKILLNDLKKNLEIEKRKKYSKLANRYIWRPISIYFTVPFVILKIKSDSVTYLRAALLIILFTLSFFVDSSKYVYILLGAFFCQILDYVDGNLARHNKTTSLYGKFIDGLFDSLLPMVYIALPLLNQKVNNNLINLELDILLISFILVSFFFTNIFNSRRARFEYLFQNNEKQKDKNIIKKTGEEKSSLIKNILNTSKKGIDFLNQTHIIVSIVLSIFSLQKFIILYLLILRVLNFTLIARATVSIKKRWIEFNY